MVRKMKENGESNVFKGKREPSAPRSGRACGRQTAAPALRSQDGGAGAGRRLGRAWKTRPSGVTLQAPVPLNHLARAFAEIT